MGRLDDREDFGVDVGGSFPARYAVRRMKKLGTIKTSR